MQRKHCGVPLCVRRNVSRDLHRDLFAMWITGQAKSLVDIAPEFLQCTRRTIPLPQREVKDKNLQSKPVVAKFLFRLKDGKLTEVSEAGRL